MLVPRRLPFLVFAVTAAVGLVLPIAAYRSATTTNYLRFERLADEAVDRIAMRFNQHLSLLFATRALFETQSGNVSHRQFAEFIRHLNIEQLYDGIQGIGYTAVLPPEGDDWVRSLLRTNYGLDRAPFPASTQDLRTAIIMLEPDDERNRTALGYDMYSEEVRRTAMQAAIFSGEAQASGKVELIQEIDHEKQAGFLVFVPMYAGGGSTDDVGNNPSGNIGGFVYAAFRIGDLVNAALTRSSGLPVHLEIHDSDPENDQLLFASTTQDLGFGDGYTVERDLNIAGRRWNVTITPSAGFEEGADKGIALLLGAISLLMAAALAASMRSQLKALDASHEVIRVNEEAAAQKDFLLQEMKHRIKNSIARVLAIARQTANHSESLSEFNESFTNRLQAMAASQDLLTHSHWEKTNLDELLHQELRQVFGPEFEDSTVSGPRQELGVRSTQAMALVFHELATNALKYAGMDEPGSYLEIKWKKGSDGKSLVLIWSEHHAAGSTGDEEDNQPNEFGGFGTKLMRSLVEGELSGSIVRELKAGELRVRIEIPDPLQ